MKFNFDYYNNLEEIELRLCNPDGRELFPLPGKSVNLTLRFNDISSLTFEVSSQIALSSGEVITLEAYDYIQTKRLVYATNVGWFQISAVDEHDNGISRYKSITAESYQSVLKHRGFVSEERVYCFYNPNDPYDENYDSLQEDSIPSVLGQLNRQLGIEQDLDQGLEEPNQPYDVWTVTYVEDLLDYSKAGSLCRTFKKNTTFGYDWIINDVEEAFGVVIIFDFLYKAIHVRIPAKDVYPVSSGVVYTFDNFMKNIKISESADNIVTVLNCNGDNCNITGVNPTGTNYICDFSYYMDKVNGRWMSAELIAKLEAWKKECDDNKQAYEGYISQLRTLYQSATEKEALLREMSLSLADLKTAQSKRMDLGDAEPGSLCGVVVAEKVNVVKKTVNGEETVVGGKSIKPESDFYSTEFLGTSVVRAYQYAPKYDGGVWSWSENDAYKDGTADQIIEDNMAATKAGSGGATYWYFSDVADGSSYCKLQSAAYINKADSTTAYYCGGFNRIIAYAYPENIMNDDGMATGVFTYRDGVQNWINLRENHVKLLNTELCGYAFTTTGYDNDYEKTVDDGTGSIYITTGSGGSLLPKQYEVNGVDGVLLTDSIYKSINDLNDTIGAITSRLNILAYFSDAPALLRELNCYWIEGDYTNENIAVLDDTTPDVEIDLSNELLASGYVELSKVSQPQTSFSLESVNVIAQPEFKDQIQALELGKLVAVEKDDGVWYSPALLELSINLDGGKEFTMAFANSLRLDDWGYTYADFIASSASTSRRVSANWQNMTAYAKDKSTIASITRDPLNSSLRAATTNAVNQDFTVTSRGILGKKRADESDGDHENEQVMLINNMLMFTDDNWKTAKAALGKIHYKVGEEEKVAYGLIAEAIIGKLLMGESLVISNSNNTISLDGDGIKIKKATTANGTTTLEEAFHADSNGSLSILRADIGDWHLGPTDIQVDNTTIIHTTALYTNEIENGTDRSHRVYLTAEGVYVDGRYKTSYETGQTYRAHKTWLEICGG